MVNGRYRTKEIKSPERPEKQLIPPLSRISSEQLNVVTVYFNPIRWANRRKTHSEFEEHMLDSGVALTTVEVALGRRPYNLPDHKHITRIRLRTDSLVWNKETATNIGFSRIAEDAKYLAWIDGDVFFRRDDWARETVHALQQYEVIQPWSHAYDLGPNGEHMQVHMSFCHQYWHGLPVGPCKKPYNFAHPGYAWAARRTAYNCLGGLLEVGVLGSGDHHMAMCMVGEGERSLPPGLTRAYRRHVLDWQERAEHCVKRNLGYIDGTIEHSWHGKKADRRYVDRWKILRDFKFDPDTDLKRNAWGLWELKDGTQRLRQFRHAIDRYMRARLEDANVMV